MPKFRHQDTVSDTLETPLELASLTVECLKFEARSGDKMMWREILFVPEFLLFLFLFLTVTPTRDAVEIRDPHKLPQ